MDFNLLKSLIGNLNVNFNFSDQRINSPDNRTKQKNVAKKQAVQVIINGNVVNNVVISENDKAQSDNPEFKKGYHAVFLTNGQVYFGQLEKINTGRFAKLVDVFYLGSIDIDENVSSVVRTTTGLESRVDRQETPLSINLVKLGHELHAPIDEMNINVDQILFWEKLQDSGFVVQSILRYNETR
jgi:hypothetical protein